MDLRIRQLATEAGASHRTAAPSHCVSDVERAAFRESGRASTSGAGLFFSPGMSCTPRSRETTKASRCRARARARRTGVGGDDAAPGQKKRRGRHQQR